MKFGIYKKRSAVAETARDTPYRLGYLEHLHNFITKRRRSAVIAFRVGFPPNILASPPKSPKNHFGGPLNAKPIIQRALRESRVNGATQLNLQLYRDRQALLCVCQKFSATGLPEGAGPPSVNLGPLISRKVLEL